MHHFFHDGQNVSCLKCRKDGASPWKGLHRTQGKNLRECVRCKKSKMQSMFRTSRGNHSNTCKECEVVRCASCCVEKRTTCFNAKSVANHFQHDRDIVCAECEEKGCSNKDPKLYQCTGQCGAEHGHKMFNNTQLRNFKKGHDEMFERKVA